MRIRKRNILVALGFIFLMWTIWFFSDIVSYIIIAWILSLMGSPFMRAFQRIKFGRFKVSRVLAAFLTLTCYFLIIFAFFALFAPLIFMQARNLATIDYSVVAQGFEAPIQSFTGWMVNIGLIESLDESPTEFLKENLFKKLSPSNITVILGSAINFTGNLLIAVASITFITFFFLKEDQLFVRVVLALVPLKFHGEIKNIIDGSIHLLTRYFGGIFIQITIITIFVSIFLSILDIPNALLIGFFAALMNIIPYVGPALGGAFGIFIAISSNLDADFYIVLLPMIGQVIMVFAAMQVMDNFILQPYIFSNSVMAHPLEVFVIIMAGAKLGGISGMVLAIPVYTVVRVIARVFWSEFRVIEKMTAGIQNDPRR